MISNQAPGLSEANGDTRRRNHHNSRLSTRGNGSGLTAAGLWAPEARPSPKTPKSCLRKERDGAAAKNTPTPAKQAAHRRPAAADQRATTAPGFTAADTQTGMGVGLVVGGGGMRENVGKIDGRKRRRRGETRQRRTARIQEGRQSQTPAFFGGGDQFDG